MHGGDWLFRLETVRNDIFWSWRCKRGIMGNDENLRMEMTYFVI